MAQVLRPLSDRFPPADFPQLAVGLDAPDDAAVYLFDDERAIVQTLDFFAPVVDDAWTFGAIAAANALSDVYAMGGTPLFALNIAAFPEDLPHDLIADILRGGADKVREADAAIAGGHTIIDEEPKYGLAVTGEVHPQRILRAGGAHPGDLILLTKPLGTGVLIGANAQGVVAAADMQAALDQMMQLQRPAAETAAGFRVHAMADVTGYGLAGHLWDMAEQGGVEIEIDLAAVPALAGLREAAAAGFGSGGQNRNRDYYGAKARMSRPRDLAPLEDALLYDPQTSGGLLIAAGPVDAPHLQHALATAGVDAAPVAKVIDHIAGGALAVSLPESPRA